MIRTRPFRLPVSTAPIPGPRPVRRVARLFALPDAVFAALRRLPGLGPAVSRLTLSLAVDDGRTRALLGWTPPVAAEAGLSLTARAFAAR